MYAYNNYFFRERGGKRERERETEGEEDVEGEGERAIIIQVENLFILWLHG